MFQPIEMKKELLKERITISSKLKSMKYFIQDKEYDCFEKMIVSIYLLQI